MFGFKVIGFKAGLLSLAVLPALAIQAAAESYTTRIETRPFYGAVVTLEEGVRVIRPLPPERHVIINPEGKTPLSLNFSETKFYEHRVIENHSAHSGVRVIYGRGPSSLGVARAVPYGARQYHYRHGVGVGH